MTAEELTELIKGELPDAHVLLEDTTGAGDRWNAIVISRRFEGLPIVQQHQLVYAALSGALRTTLHALQLKTMTHEKARATGLIQEY